MNLDKNINYIASGLERSGTSLLMQILRAGDIPINYDNLRQADNNNPKGYYELEGGKIINKLIEGSFSFNNYRGKFIKITAFGLQFLPIGKYKIIYSERNIDEIMDSMEKMIGKKDKNREEIKKSFERLNKMIKDFLKKRDDIEFLLVNYNDIILNIEENIRKITKFLEINDEAIDKMINAVDDRLYRQRRV